MKLLLDTSTPECRLFIYDDQDERAFTWDAGRGLAKGLLGYLIDTLASMNKTIAAIDGIGVFEGPGSFTGLRIGMTVLNTIAQSEHIPIVGARGDDWKREVMSKLKSGTDEKIVMPFYGSEAHITAPKK